MENNKTEIQVGSIVSLVLGIVGLFVFGLIAGIGAIAFGINKDDSFAKVGIILGIIDVVIMALYACAIF